MTNLGLLLAERAEKYGRKTAVSLGENNLSYAQLDENSNKVSNALLEMGVEKGDRIAMPLTNSPEFVSFYFGVVKIGAIAVPLDIRYKIAELVSILEDCKPKILVTESPAIELIKPALSQFKSVQQIIDLSSKHGEEFTTYSQLTNRYPAKSPKVTVNPDDVAQIHYTSGPVRHPRGAMLSHGNIITALDSSANGFAQTENDVSILFALPMHHIYGLDIIVLTTISKGGTVIMVPGLSIGTLFETIEKKRATLFLGIPFIYLLLIEAAKTEEIKHDLSSLRFWGSAGAPLSIDTIKQFQEYYGMMINDFWGLTESSIHVTCQPPDGSGKLGSVGKALRGFTLKAVDEYGREVSLNKPGELVLKGPIMTGIYQNPQATAEAIRDGWLYTGDIGRIDEDGFVFLEGRKSDFIIVKGQNIHPSDIEDVLLTHPKVAEAAVVGVPDDTRGERVRAVIKLEHGKAATEPEIKQFCRSYLADFRVPKEIIFVDSLPRTETGEIKRHEL